jgi:hypothetical protein
MDLIAHKVNYRTQKADLTLIHSYGTMDDNIVDLSPKTGIFYLRARVDLLYN